MAASAAESVPRTGTKRDGLRDLRELYECCAVAGEGVQILTRNVLPTVGYRQNWRRDPLSNLNQQSMNSAVESKSPIHQMLKEALAKYLSLLTSENLGAPVSYDEKPIDASSLNPTAAELVRGEVREMTNLINTWRGRLKQWQTWNQAIEGYDFNDAWEIRREFLEPLVHYCLLQPSSIRDALATVAANVFHQVRLAQDTGYLDVLEGEPKGPYFTRDFSIDRQGSFD